jgi:murein DD-endopeptidase MepM/ murein hydrolase activator NlpD
MVRIVKPKPTPPPAPPPVTPTPTSTKLGSYGNKSIDQWDNAFLVASDAVQRKKGVRVSPRFMKAMMDVESGGNGNLSPSWCRFDGSCGPMQIKPQYHQWRCKECSFATVSGQIELATHIIGDTMKSTGKDEYDALVRVYFPTDDISNGTTQNEYVQRIKKLIAIMEKDAGGTTPVPVPPPTGDVLDLLFGGKPYTISAGYGQRVTWSCPGCYDYFRDYGLDSGHHWAYDASAATGDGAPLYAPFAGTVVCAGTGVGSGAWGTGCFAFGRNNNYGGKPSGAGAGRLEILHEDGDRSLILGHVLSSRVRPGDRVVPGDLIGQQGGMNGSHVHVEGRYANGTRIGDPRKLFGGGGSEPIRYAERVPIPQPKEFDVSATVNVMRDGVPVLQRADLNAPKVAKDLPRGEEFEAVYQVIGNDKRIYWVTRLGSRVPVDGTQSEEWTQGLGG